MYEQFYSLKCKPFELMPNPDFLFMSNTHKKAITYLDYGIKERIGFILLTGEIGSGKTTIIRNFIKNLNGSARLSRVNNTKVSSEQLLSMINEDFGLDVEGKSKSRLLSELNEFLIEEYVNKHQSILLIDEAQNLSPDVLEEIRLLSNLETDRAKLLQIILVGQPELKNTLMFPGLLQLRQRINIKYHITPLSYDETKEYIKHRLTVAGNPDAFKLTDEVLEVICRFSKGIPRLINIICDFALLSNFVEGKSEVAIDTWRDVAKDLESKDVLNEYEKKEVPGHANTGTLDELRQETGNIALRLIKLEDAISVSSNGFLREEIKRLEDQISKIASNNDSRNINGYLEKLEEKLVYQILVRITEDGIMSNLSERVSKLEKMLSIAHENIKDNN